MRGSSRGARKSFSSRYFLTPLCMASSLDNRSEISWSGLAADIRIRLLTWPTSQSRPGRPTTKESSSGDHSGSHHRKLLTVPCQYMPLPGSSTCGVVISAITCLLVQCCNHGMYSSGGGQITGRSPNRPDWCDQQHISNGSTEVRSTQISSF